MKSNVRGLSNIVVVDKMENEDVCIEVLEYEKLQGGNKPSDSVSLYFMERTNIKLRQIKVRLKDSAIKTEAGAFYVSKGDIQMETKIGGVVGLSKKLFKGQVSGESTFKPRYTGSGEIYLEPSYSHYVLLELEDEAIIVDDGCFYMCEDSVDVGIHMQKSISSAVLGNEGLFQAKIEGSGLVVLEIPVPKEEIQVFNLRGEELKVDGNFAILRTSGLKFTVEKSSKSIIGSVTSGEGLLNVFRGHGTVWLIPTERAYKNITDNSVKNTNNSKSNTNV